MSTSKQTSGRRKMKVKLPAASGNGAKRPPSAAAAKSDERSGRGPGVKIAAYLATGVLVLAGVYALSAGSGGEQPAASSAPASATAVAGPTDSRFPFEVGAPGPGAAAPPFTLPSTSGRSFDLAGQRGDTVLLYFQEGIGCQPCWDQLTDIEPRFGEFKALGIDEIATITTDPPDLLARKVADEGITTPVMTDLNLTVSDDYSTPQYRMAGMSESFNGHSFILVGEDGEIEWRADYGGPTTGNTMYVPVESLLADIEEGTDGASS